MYPLNFVFGLTVTALSLVGLHWMPYPKRLHAIGNYTLGTLAIFIGMTIWRPGDLIVWAFPVVGGITVCLCYLVDYLLNMRVKAAIHESADTDLSRTTRN